jgi:predicted RNase H-like HicB family nuclease
MASYRVILRQSEEGYSVSCPGLLGCWWEGASKQGALANIRVAVRDYLNVAKVI